MRTNRQSYSPSTGNVKPRLSRKSAKFARKSHSRRVQPEYQGRIYSYQQATGNTTTLLSLVFLAMIAGAALADTSAAMHTRTSSKMRVSDGSQPLKQVKQRAQVSLTGFPSASGNSTISGQASLLISGPNQTQSSLSMTRVSEASVEGYISKGISYPKKPENTGPLVFIGEAKGHAAQTEKCESSDLEIELSDSTTVLDVTKARSYASIASRYLDQFEFLDVYSQFKHVIMEKIYNGNTEIENGETLYHRMMNEGRISDIKTTGTQPGAIVPRADFWHSEHAIESCFSTEGLAIIQALSLESISFNPLTVVQVLCESKVRLLSGQVVNIPGMQANDVREHLLKRKFGHVSFDQKAENLLIIYPGPGHALLRIDCQNCDEGLPFHRPVGVMPKPVVDPEATLAKTDGSDLEVFFRSIHQVVKATEDFSPWPLNKLFHQISRGTRYAALQFPDRIYQVEHQIAFERSMKADGQLRILVPLTDALAAKAMAHIRFLERSCDEGDYKTCRYNLIENNCADFVDQVTQAAGDDGSYGSYLDDQLMRDGGIPKLTLGDYLRPWKGFSKLYYNKAAGYIYAKAHGNDKYLELMESEIPALKVIGEIWEWANPS